MFIVRESVQACGERVKTLVGENSFATRHEAKLGLIRQYRELLGRQENWPGVWSRSLSVNRYTVDNNDGDFFEGEICERFES